MGTLLLLRWSWTVHLARDRPGGLHGNVHQVIGADFRSEVPGQSLVGLIGGGRGQWLGGTMASAEHEPIMAVWGQSPQRGPGAEPLVRGAKPPEAESISVIGCPTEPENLAPLVKFSKCDY